jgi:hypothetical protein
MKSFTKGTFGYDWQYLSGKDSLIVLRSADERAQVIVSPKYQAKVFTSTAAGLDGPSLGYVNYKALDAGPVDEHMNGYGGENRFWLGPEGGPYSVFFPPAAEQVFAHWHTPSPIDVEPWNMVSSGKQSVVLSKDMSVVNYVGTRLRLAAKRSVELLSPARIESTLGVRVPPGVDVVAYTTRNRITNRNTFAWTPQTGTLCIWILDMFHTAPRAVTIVPYRPGDERRIGRIVTSDYFGPVPADRLAVTDRLICLKTDGEFRSKLGVSGRRALPLAANYDPDAHRLTIVSFEVDAKASYLNQAWDPHMEALGGDAINAYNDGPLEDGTILGPVLELESVSPAAFLAPGESLSHRHSVYHFLGSEVALQPVAEAVLGASLREIRSAFQADA